MKGWKITSILVVVLVAFAWSVWALITDTPKYNVATYYTDLANGHPQELPEGLAIDCAAPSNSA
jgi:hypothetical protein